MGISVFFILFKTFVFETFFHSKKFKNSRVKVKDYNLSRINAKKESRLKKTLPHTSVWQNDFDLDVRESCMLIYPLMSLHVQDPTGG